MSNFVFSRRALQRLIDDLAPVLEGAQLQAIVDRLNGRDESRLHAMWEAVFLAVLSRMGPLRHEVALPSGRAPDFEVDLGGFMLIGDVRTVSDSGLDKNNPIDLLSDEIRRLAGKHRLPPNGFYYDVRGEMIGRHGNARQRLLLPARGDLQRVIREDVEPFIRNLGSSPDAAAESVFQGEGYAFTIKYDPGQRFGGGGHAAYDVAASRTKNPLYNALQSKADQLRTAPEDSVRLIIACDADSATLRRSALMRSPGTFTAREIAEDFLRQYSSIDLVLLVTVDEATGGFLPKAELKMKYDLVARRPQKRSVRLTYERLKEIEERLQKALVDVPQPLQTPYNSVLRLRETAAGPDMIGGYQIEGRRMTLSARAVQRLLAGQITPEEFARAHDWDEPGRMPNPFRAALQRGHMIKSVKVESAGDQDDDWLQFEFGPDPAQGPFRAPAADETADPATTTQAPDDSD